MGFFSQSSHFYKCPKDGPIEAAHDLDLRQARKVNAFPSITTVLKERANAGLDTWKQNMIFDTVVKNPRGSDETVEDYKDRIAELSGKKGSEAADFGTILHDALDQYPQLPLDPDLRPYVQAFAPSYEKHVKERVCSEIMLADYDLGVAGRTDLIADTYEWGLAVIDYKTSKFKSGKPSFWSSYIVQLAFYAKTYQKMKGLKDCPVIINVGINSENPTEPVWKRYSTEEQQAAYAEFLAIAFLWFSTKNYWPTTSFKRWIAHFQVNGSLHSA